MRGRRGRRVPDGSLASIEPREVEQVVDQVPEATAVPRELRLDRVPRGTRRLIPQEPLGGRLQGGDRRAKFVRASARNVRMAA
jgi:hypothetical protein